MSQPHSFLPDPLRSSRHLYVTLCLIRKKQTNESAKNDEIGQTDRQTYSHESTIK